MDPRYLFVSVRPQEKAVTFLVLLEASDNPSEAKTRSGGALPDKYTEGAALGSSSLEGFSTQRDRVLQSRLWAGLHGLHSTSSWVIMG